MLNKTEGEIVNAIKAKYINTLKVDKVSGISYNLIESRVKVTYVIGKNVYIDNLTVRTVEEIIECYKNGEYDEVKEYVVDLGSVKYTLKYKHSNSQRRGSVEIYREDGSYWGSPQAEIVMLGLLKDIEKLKGEK